VGEGRGGGVLAAILNGTPNNVLTLIVSNGSDMQTNFQLLWRCVVLEKVVFTVPVNKCQTFVESEAHSYVRRTVF